jgi:hypothetical protein
MILKKNNRLLLLIGVFIFIIAIILFSSIPNVGLYLYYVRFTGNLNSEQIMYLMSINSNKYIDPVTDRKWRELIRHGDEPLVIETLINVSENENSTGSMAKYSLFRLRVDAEQYLVELLDELNSNGVQGRAIEADILTRYIKPGDIEYLDTFLDFSKTDDPIFKQLLLSTLSIFLPNERALERIQQATADKDIEVRKKANQILDDYY